MDATLKSIPLDVETIRDIYVGKQINCYVLDIENVMLHEFNINTGIE